MSLQKLLKNSYKGKKQDKKINNFIRDDSLSGERVQVYYDPTTKKAVTVHRGTSGIHDMANDAGLLIAPSLFKYTNRYKQAEKIQKLADEKYGHENVTTTGHSLGGKIASDLKRKTDDKVITYNKAIVPSDLLFAPNKNETHIRTQFDPISFLAPFDRTKTVTVPSDSLAGVHDIENLANYHPKDNDGLINFV